MYEFSDVEDGLHENLKNNPGPAGLSARLLLCK